jgi:glycerol kinase
LETVVQCIAEAMSEYKASEVVSIGITNQRETTIVWDKFNGKPLYNAIVWSDARTSGIVEEMKKKYKNNADHFRGVCGLPLSTYFSALKLKWMIDNVPEVKKAVDEKRALFGTVDTWLIWNLTGGVSGMK